MSAITKDSAKNSFSFSVPWRPSQTPGEKAAEDAHEAQHRADWWSQYPEPDWKKEQRGFAAEISILKKRIAELKAKEYLTEAEKADLAAMETELQVAESIANSDQATKDYYNDTKRWWQSPAK